MQDNNKFKSFTVNYIFFKVLDGREHMNVRARFVLSDTESF